MKLQQPYARKKASDSAKAFESHREKNGDKALKPTTARLISPQEMTLKGPGRAVVLIDPSSIQARSF
jgi:hypothetical protein